MKSVRILAPAKVNLGLAVLGKRDDGYHDIDTIMAMIDLCDEIIVTPRTDQTISIAGMDGVPTESNLMWKAAHLWREAAGNEAGYHIEIDKHIPSPAGLGGGSSNAASVLLALNQIHEQPLSHDDLHVIAATIGADCPFFLEGPAARATGIGTDLRTVSAPTGWVVLAVPGINEPAKTAKLYGELSKQDYGEPTMIDEVELHLVSGKIGDAPLPNSFSEPAQKLLHGMSSLQYGVRSITGKANLSGAGPAIYSITSSGAEAETWVETLRHAVPEGVTIHIARFLQSRPAPELLP